MFRIVRFPTGLLAASILMACGYFEDDAPYPSIDKAKLEGCWVYTNPGIFGFKCMETCFSKADFYYSRSNDRELQNGNQTFVEGGGTYSVKGNTITIFAKYGNNVEKPDSTIRKIQDSYTIMRDTLFSIPDNGSNLIPLVHADPSSTCGPHWQVFPEPEGWDLN